VVLIFIWFSFRYQYIDLPRFGMSRGELNAVVKAVGLSSLIDERCSDYPLLQYLAYDADKLEKLLENPRLLRTPIVRNGREATVGYCPDVWKTWE
jgi:arsenate reductase-like glutaredoxin family protein